MKKVDFYSFFLHYIKKLLIIKKNRETILNRAKKYYEDKKEVLREKAKHKYIRSL